MKKILNRYNINNYGDLFLGIIKLLCLITFITCIISVTYTTIEHFPKIVEKTNGSNLGLLLQSLQKKWFISFLLSFLITYLSFTLWMIFTLILNLKFTKKYFKISFFCTFGINIITFIFIFILASTTPSNSTIVFSTLSAIGASISFCYTVFNNNRGNL